MFGKLFGKKSVKSAADEINKYNKAARNAAVLNKVGNIALGTSAATFAGAVAVKDYELTTKMSRKDRKKCDAISSNLGCASVATLGIGGVTKVVANVITPIPKIDLADFDDEIEVVEGAEQNAQ